MIARRRLSRTISRSELRIARVPSPMLAYATPWTSIVLASIVPGWLIVASAPLVPPLGYLMLLSWRQLRPGLLPVWAGLPLGLVDDLFSGQPFGSAILLWSGSMLLLDIVEHRFPWRDFTIDWMTAAAMIVAYGIFGMGIAGAGMEHLPGVALQTALGVLFYPAVGRLVAWCDEARLTRFRML